MIEIILGFGLPVALAAATYLGAKSGTAANPPTIVSPAGSSAADCKTACAAFDSARQMQCIARANEATARSRADSIRAQMFAFIAAAAVLAASAAATLALAVAAAASFFGIPLAIVLRAAAAGLAVAAAAAATMAANLAGQLAA